MGRIYDRIDDHQRAWIARQPMFFVGTAPLGADGHVNISPKGPIGTLRVLDDHTVAYLDMLGSGAETIAHLRENGRIVVMLCAFDGPPRILRLHGQRHIVAAGDAGFGELLERADFDEPAVERDPPRGDRRLRRADRRLVRLRGAADALRGHRGRISTRGRRRSSASAAPRRSRSTRRRTTPPASTACPRLRAS